LKEQIFRHAKKLFNRLGLEEGRADLLALIYRNLVTKKLALKKVKKKSLLPLIIYFENMVACLTGLPFIRLVFWLILDDTLSAGPQGIVRELFQDSYPENSSFRGWQMKRAQTLGHLIGYQQSADSVVEVLHELLTTAESPKRVESFYQRHLKGGAGAGAAGTEQPHDPVVAMMHRPLGSRVTRVPDFGALLGELTQEDKQHLESEVPPDDPFYHVMTNLRNEVMVCAIQEYLFSGELDNNNDNKDKNKNKKK